MVGKYSFGQGDEQNWQALLKQGLIS
jgi:hypothetical protein